MRHLRLVGARESGTAINSSFFDSAAALSTKRTQSLFVSARPGGLGSNDIWVSQRRCADCPWEDPTNLTVVNSTTADGGPSLSADGHLLFFHSFRPVGMAAVTSGCRVELTRMMTSAGKPR